MYKGRMLASLGFLSILVFEIICLRDLPDVSPGKIYTNSPSGQNISSESNNIPLPERRKTAPEIRKSLRTLLYEKHYLQVGFSGLLNNETISEIQKYQSGETSYTRYYDTHDKRIIIGAFLIHLNSPPKI